MGVAIGAVLGNVLLWIGAEPASVRPADQHLRGAERPHTRDLQQPGRDRTDQRGQLGLELVGLQELDALGGGPQGPRGGLVLQRPGGP
jgi:hypothetical protein